MSESIIERLKIISTYLPYQPYACVAASQLTEIREEIRRLKYDDFLRVLDYVRGSSLPRDFQQNLETEYTIRNMEKAKKLKQLKFFSIDSFIR